MKHLRKIFSILMVAVICMTVIAVPVSAANIQEYQQSSVLIGSTVKYHAPNLDITLSISSTGTGFAVGTPGEPVQFIATCAHVVSEPEGIYAILIDPDNGNYVDKVAMPEGTSYPSRDYLVYNNTEYLALIDYFSTETTDLYACFSSSTNDYVTLTIAQINQDVDLAVCKLASQPTTKISALPIQLKKDVPVNTDVIAIGYPSTSKVFNAEERFDSSDSTVKDGIISKLQRTNGLTGSKTTYDTYEVTAELITGMSGGPVISEESGAVVGVTAFGVTDYTQAAAARYAVCIDYLIEMLDRESIPYQLADSSNLLMIILICAGAAVLIGVVVLIIVLATKKKAPVPVPVPVPSAAPAPVPSAAPAPEPAPANKYHLYGVSGPLAGKKFAITSSAVIGRDSNRCNITFPVDQAGVSGVHCEIKITGDGMLTLRDCGSSYGTFLDNGTKLEANVPVILSSSAKFFIGSEKIAFEVRY